MKPNKGVSEPGKYVGVHSGGQLPCGVVYKELERERTVHGKKVQYYHCWVKESTEKPVFQDDEEPNPAKIRRVEKILNGNKD